MDVYWAHATLLGVLPTFFHNLIMIKHTSLLPLTILWVFRSKWCGVKIHSAYDDRNNCILQDNALEVGRTNVIT